MNRYTENLIEGVLNGRLISCGRGVLDAKFGSSWDKSPTNSFTRTLLERGIFYKKCSRNTSTVQFLDLKTLPSNTFPELARSLPYAQDSGLLNELLCAFLRAKISNMPGGIFKITPDTFGPDNRDASWIHNLLEKCSTTYAPIARDFFFVSYQGGIEVVSMTDLGLKNTFLRRRETKALTFRFPCEVPLSDCLVNFFDPAPAVLGAFRALTGMIASLINRNSVVPSSDLLAGVMRDVMSETGHSQWALYYNTLVRTEGADKFCLHLFRRTDRPLDSELWSPQYSGKIRSDLPAEYFRARYTSLLADN